MCYLSCYINDAIIETADLTITMLRLAYAQSNPLATSIHTEDFYIDRIANFDSLERFGNRDVRQFADVD